MHAYRHYRQQHAINCRLEGKLTTTSITPTDAGITRAMFTELGTRYRQLIGLIFSYNTCFALSVDLDDKQSAQEFPSEVCQCTDYTSKGNYWVRRSTGLSTLIISLIIQFYTLVASSERLSSGLCAVVQRPSVLMKSQGYKLNCLLQQQLLLSFCALPLTASLA